MIKNNKPRTKEEVEIFYNEYLNGSTIDEISLKYGTDAYYQFKKKGFIIRSPKMSRLLRRKKGLASYYNEYTYMFDKISNEMEAYIMGFWFSDGWVSTKQAGLKLSKIDENILIKIKNYISKEVNMSYYKNSCGFVISSEEIINNLIKLGCLRNKTYKKLEIPKMNDELLRHFIRGYFDGDGTIYRDKKRLKCNICSINKEFLEDIQKILTNNNIISTINIEIREGKVCKTPQGFSINCKNMYRLFIRQTTAFRDFYNFMYKDSNIYLERKYIKFDNGNIVLTE